MCGAWCAVPKTQIRKTTMKKLMMALGVVALAATVQAATFRWYNNAPIYEAGSTTDYLTSGTVYLFSGNGQSALLAGYLAAADADTYLTSAANYVGKSVINGATTFASTTVDGASITSGRAVWSETTSDTSRNYFQVLVDGDSIYIADTMAVSVKTTGNSNIAFVNNESKAAALDASTGYAGGGWYTTAVPEPTSGLLMLLGMAGLALRRRRA